MPKTIVAKDKLAAEQTRVTYIYSMLAFATLLVFGVLQIIVEGNSLLGYLEITGGLAILLAAASLRFTQNSNLVRRLVLLSILAMLVVMLATGGTENTGIFWTYIFPVSAFFLTSKKEGVWWMAGLLAVIGVFMWLSHVGILATPYSFIMFRQLLVSLIVVTIGIYVYQSSRETLALETERSDVASREEHNKADIIIDNIDEGVVVVDRDGVVVLASKAALDLLGWQNDEFVGKPFVEVAPMVDGNDKPVDSTQRPIFRALSQKESVKTRAFYTRKNGRKMPVEVSSRAIIVDGKVRGAVCTFRDITKENAVDRAKSEFVTLASHQLRTPISAIAWAGELLVHGDAGKLKPEQMEYVQQIYQSNKRMAALVDAMLIVSSLELGSMPVRPEKLDLQKICREVLAERLAAVPKEKVLHVKENYSPELGEVMFDPNVAKMILQNLIANSFKYTPHNGNVTITLRQDAKEIAIEVTDDGMGIPSNQQSKIFTKLFRADNVKRQDTDGTGLGLYTVKTVAEYAGGRMVFDSQENKGSTFTVFFPKSGMVEKEGIKDAPIA